MNLCSCWWLVCLVGVLVLGCETQIIRVHRDADAVMETHGADTTASTFVETQQPSRQKPGPIECSWTVIFRDADQDGFGDPNVSVKHCVDDAIADGWTSKGGDCNDANPAMNISCSVKTKPTTCPNNCADDNPYSWGYCQQDDSTWCEGYEAWMQIQCRLPNETTVSPPQPLWFGCMPTVWIVIPNKPVEMNLGQSLMITQNGSSQVYLKDLKTVCESLAQPGAVMHVNAIALDKNNKQISSIGGANVWATDSFWWGSKHNPFHGKPGASTVFEQPDFLYFFNDFPLCVKAKQEVEANGGVYPPPD